jgi:hypothetical protein
MIIASMLGRIFTRLRSSIFVREEYDHDEDGAHIRGTKNAKP